MIRFLLDQSKKDPEKYSKFFEDYGLFIREGIVTTQEQDVKVASLTEMGKKGSPTSLRGCVTLFAPLNRRILQSC